mmetsp:Transcript_5922/g.8784  ORF Transcript_5922/g.8784 Transcript_5922/m.8784 type:complete len:95 (+) Transcript_5922:141-425(+)
MAIPSVNCKELKCKSLAASTHCLVSFASNRSLRIYSYPEFELFQSVSNFSSSTPEMKIVQGHLLVLTNSFQVYSLPTMDLVYLFLQTHPSSQRN